MKQKIEAVIFDADGTILDTRELTFEAFRHVFAQHSQDMPPLEELLRFGGRPSEEAYAHFAPQHDALALRAMHRAFQETNLDLFAAYAGLDELMAALKQQGLKIGICTNRSTNVMQLLEHLGLHDRFDGIMHADLIKNVKPDPEGLLRLCEQFNVPPKRTVMVGDTDIDIKTGKAAGCALTIAVTHGVGTRDVFQEVGADHIVEHLSDILPLVIS